MKKNIILYTLAAFALALGFTACEDEPDRYEMTGGTPTIHYVKPAGATADTLLTSAYMGNSVCIVGDNLRSIYRIYFNDVEATLNTSYMTDHTVLVDIPNVIPGEVSNKIYFYNKKGEKVDFDFSILIPGPSISAMSCEYAAPGTVATLTGDYFVDDPNVPLTVTFENGGEAVIRDITKNVITFVIPDAAAEGAITVGTVYGETTSAFHYMDSRGMLFDFDTNPLLTNHGWHAAKIETDETSLSGNFMRLGDPAVTMSEDGGWNDDNFAFQYWPGDWTTPVSYDNSPLLTDIADFSNWQNMGLKFEINIPSANPWGAGMMQIIMAGVDKISGSSAGTDIYGNTVAGANNDFMKDSSVPHGLYQPWTPSQMFDTGGEWITVTVPFSNFMYNFDGSQSDGTLSEKSFTSLTIFVVGGVTGQECQPVLKIDNIRAVPVK